MRLSEHIREAKPTVVERWYDLLLESYPPETVTLWKSKQDKFTSPVGATFSKALRTLVDEVVAWRDASALTAPLEDIVRIRAVQEMAPGKALAFILGFKKLLRELFAEDITREDLVQELAMYDARIDNLALLAFDVYTKNREKLFEMRVTEFKNAYHMVFRKAGIVCDTPRSALGLEDET
jgi:hypothetical protein